MIYTENNFPDYKSFLVQCDCQDLGHVARLSYFIEKDEAGFSHVDFISLELLANPFLPWYKRLWFALKYFIKPSLNFRSSYYDSIVLSIKDVRELSNIFFLLWEEHVALENKIARTSSADQAKPKN